MRGKVLGLITLGFLAAALVAGFVPFSSGGVSCGSAFAGSDDAYVADLTSTLSGSLGPITHHASACDSLRSVVSIPAFVLLGVAAVMLIAWMVVAGKDPKPTAQPAEAGSAR